jgi:JmjC domain, hydroxylase
MKEEDGAVAVVSQHQSPTAVAEDLFSDHTVSMRRALEYCRGRRCAKAECSSQHTHEGDDVLQQQHQPPTPAVIIASPSRMQRCRQPASSTKAWDRRPNSNHNDDDDPMIGSVDCINDLSAITATEFRDRYLIANRPCLVRGSSGGDSSNNSLRAHFATARTNWVVDDEAAPAATNTNQSSSNNRTRGSTNIHRDWFVKVLGSDRLVPVRVSQVRNDAEGCCLYHDQDEALLDEEGRARECKTDHMTLEEWFDLLEGHGGGDKEEEDHRNFQRETDRASYYLKDWHLQSWLEDIGVPPLYTVPEHFQYDLLNNFLTHFTSGDYRFVYWGPTGSQAAIHSDVMNSFSWSYNVCGRKEWTFYVDNDNDAIGNNNNTNDRTIQFVQRSGELVFVPATWRHSVMNLEETISINHNWITTVNVQLVWDCLHREINAIEMELQSWKEVELWGWDARENMLRGCAGLDATTFYFMLLTRGLDLTMEEHGNNNNCGGNEDDDDGRHFDLVHLRDMLSQLLHTETLFLHNRLAAVLADSDLASIAIQIGHTFVDCAPSALM